ncbi:MULTISPECIES: hypothetical protein [Clostridium]|uniref:hypothetical protein n=1 Tax=Clostridium TaxID=1485 RepID=UPI0008265280|nr:MULTISPECIES: hypothetical protein [Clostridium]PJI10424.1 hypothetical protein CUB90_00025 [Clostridium sp. CT7]
MNKKSSKAKELINKNNELREKLLPENKEYYEKLLLYIRTSGLFYDEYEVEALLIQILQDTISAQENGDSARDFFGKSPQEAADELIGNFSHGSKPEILKFAGIIFAISAFFPILSMLSTDKGINPIVLILDGILSFITVEIVFSVLHKGIYTKIIKNKIVSFMIIWIFFALIIGLFVLIDIFTPSMWNLNIAGSIKVLIISIVLFLTIFEVCTQKHVERSIFIPFIPPIWVLGLFAICANITLTKTWISTKNGKIISVVLILAANFIFYILTYFLNREKKASNKF